MTQPAAPPQPDQVEPTSGEPRDALIFLSGVGGTTGIGPDQTMDGVALRMMTALRRQAQPQVSFRLDAGEIQYGEGNPNFKSRRCTIHKKTGASEQPLIDLYAVDYSTTLTGRYEHRSLLLQTLLSVVTVMNGILLLYRTPWREKKTSAGQTPASAGPPAAMDEDHQPLTSRQKMQLLWALVILFLMSVYTIALAFTFVDALTQIKNPAPPKQVTVDTDKVSAAVKEREAAAADEKTKSARKSSTQSTTPPTTTLPANAVVKYHWGTNYVRHLLRSLIILLTAAGVLTNVNWRQKLKAVATQYFSVYEYINGGAVRVDLRGQLESLLDTVIHQPQKYRKIDVVAFSFGTIVLLDSLFPPTAPDPQWSQVDTIVTIGCPFDLIRTLWPQYFRNRRGSAKSNSPRSWCNIYMLNDILGANFRNDERADVATKGIETFADNTPVSQRPTNNILFEIAPADESGWFMKLVKLYGFQAHTLYWGRGNATEANCFGEIVRCLYGDISAPAGSANTANAAGQAAG